MRLLCVGLCVMVLLLAGCQAYRDLKQGVAEAMHPDYYQQQKAQRK